MGLYDTSMGTLLLGVFFNTYLYGLVTYQFVAYYRAKFNDRPITKYMVLFLFILDTVHSASAIYMVWDYTVTNYDNPAALSVAEWPYTFTPIGTALAALVTQLYLGLRIYRLTNSKLLYGIVIVLAIPTFIFGMICSIEAWVIKVVTDFPRIIPLAIAWLTLQILVDTFITITLTTIFTRSRTGFHKTDSVLNRLIRGAIQTCLFPSIFSLGDLIMFVILPTTNFDVMFGIPVGRLYTNTLMDTLLARESLKAEMSGTYEVNGTSGIGWAPPETTRGTTTVQSSFQLQVHKTVQEDRMSYEETDGKAASLAV